MPFNLMNKLRSWITREINSSFWKSTLSYNLPLIYLALYKIHILFVLQSKCCKKCKIKSENQSSYSRANYSEKSIPKHSQILSTGVNITILGQGWIFKIWNRRQQLNFHQAKKRPRSSLISQNDCKNNKCSCSGPQAFKSGSCRLRFS